MTFEEAQQIIKQILASQAQHQERHQNNEREIERMLAIQRDLQEGQLRLQESQLRLQDGNLTHQQEIERMLAVQQDLQEGQLRQLGAIEKLLVQSERQERIMNQLIGYSISNESVHLDLEEKIRALGAKVKKIENHS